MQDYFNPNQMPTQLAKFTFLCRSRMLCVGANYKAGISRPLCPLCNTEYDSQSHLLECPRLNDENSMCHDIPKYEDLFCENISKKLTIVRILSEKFKTRTKLIKDRKS